MLKHAELSEKEVEILDLRDENCPFTFVKTKLKLEELKGKETRKLKVVFADETTARDVAKSVTSEGYDVLTKKSDEGWILEITLR